MLCSRRAIGPLYTCVNSFLTPGELAYILRNSLSQVLITSWAKREVALAALPDCPTVKLVLIVDGPSKGESVVNLDEATGRTGAHSPSPIADHRGTQKTRPRSTNGAGGGNRTRTDL